MISELGSRTCVLVDFVFTILCHSICLQVDFGGFLMQTKESIESCSSASDYKLTCSLSSLPVDDSDRIDPVSMEEGETRSHSPTADEQPTSSHNSSQGPLQKSCRICGDTALNMNFGAVSCESCKAFFRRNALKVKQLVCPFENSCRIDIESRRWCQHCRMRKCLEVGMKKELIQKGKRAIIDRDMEVASVDAQSPSPPTEDPSHSLPKKIKKEPAFSAATGVFPADTLQVMLGNTSGLVLAVCSPTPSAESFSSVNSSADAALLDGCDLEVLCPFEKEKVIELIRANEEMIESNPSEDTVAIRRQENVRLVDVINMTDIAIRRLIKMCKRISSFKSLIQEDQISLLKGACFEMMILRAVTHYNLEKDCWRGPLETMIKVDVLKEARGNCYEEIKAFIHSFASELRGDEPLLLILGAITLFHPGRPTLEMRGQIAAQQSLYYFILHSYIRAKYGKGGLGTTEQLYMQMTAKVDLLHLLNDRHISMFMEVNPKDVEPLLIEIFDLKLAVVNVQKS